MYDLLRKKFANYPLLRKMLMETGDAILIEGNYWNDRFWGICGEGLNVLGILLMLVREQCIMRTKIEQLLSYNNLYTRLKVISDQLDTVINRLHQESDSLCESFENDANDIADHIDTMIIAFNKEISRINRDLKEGEKK
jgi:hypothetical protein